MLKDLKETICKALKKSMKTMPHQIENINKEVEIIQINQTEILELKHTIT